MYASPAGEYAGFATAAEAHQHFVNRVEKIVSQDVAGFVALVAPTSEVPNADVPRSDIARDEEPDQDVS
ncbi:hypothetical protein [Ilumatobacter sp.]|uniref:hypothetical protein n=1 Tax=Ilumatobacter sp. TaxID=1967498 RepID=UPI003C4C9C8E